MGRRHFVATVCLFFLLPIGAAETPATTAWRTLSAFADWLTPPAHASAGTLHRATQAALQRAFAKRTVSQPFRVPVGLEAPTVFWRNIYALYDRNQVVLHDTEHLDIVYGVLDLSDISALGDPFASFPPGAAESRRTRVQAGMTKVRESLLRLAENPGRSDITPLERKIVALFRNIPGGATKFREAAQGGRLRSQTGLKDRFRAGIVSSGKYLQQIEQIFREEGVPWEVTRLVFVESMFDLRAYSKVGASGIWQFMPATARLMGLTMNTIVDERNDPMAATRASARLLRKNYDMLGTWPLAINAYNAGPGRLRQAVQTMGTTSIATIIRHFRHPGYQFASRNFVPEFYAALDTFENRRKYFGDVRVAAPLEYDTVITAKAVDMPRLATVTDLPLARLWELNPGYSAALYRGKLMLPAGYALKVPKQQQRRFIATIDRVGTAIVASTD